MTFSNKDKSITKEEAWNKASFLCASSEKCLYDIQEKLKSWGCNSDDSEQICQRLIEEQYIDQTRYAYFYVKDKFRFNKWGKIKIKITPDQNESTSHPLSLSASGERTLSRRTTIFRHLSWLERCLLANYEARLYLNST